MIISVNSTDKVVHRFKADIEEANCFYFCSHFYEAFKKFESVEGATLIEDHRLKEVIAYCGICREILLDKFYGFNTLSDDFFFFFESRKLLIQYFVNKIPGVNYAVYVTTSV